MVIMLFAAFDGFINEGCSAQNYGDVRRRLEDKIRKIQHKKDFVHFRAFLVVLPLLDSANG